MKNLLKRLCSIVLSLVLIFTVVSVSVNALSGSTTIYLSSNNPKVGDALRVTIRVKADTTISEMTGILTFDRSVVKFLNGVSGEANMEGSNVRFSNAGSDSSLVVSMDFEVIAEGNFVFSAKDVKITGSGSKVSATGASLRVKTSGSQNNNQQDLNSNTKAALTSITVASGTLSPAFNSNITEYTVVVPFTQTDGVLSCESLDPRASISVEGERELKVGNNVRTIIVVASNGETRRYTVTFNRLDENGNDVTVSGNVTDILLNVDGKDYYIAEQDATLEPPVGFSLATIEYGEKEVTAYKDVSGKTVLLYLIEKDGENGAFFLYENGKVSSVAYISTVDFTYIVKDVSEEAPEGLYNATHNLNGKKVSCYKYTDVELAEFIIFSAISPEGNLGYYSYDIREKTVQRIVKFAVAVSDENEEVTVTPSNKTAVIALLIIFAVLFILLVVILIAKASKKKGKNIGRIFDTEEEYEMDSYSSYPDDE